MVVKNRIDTKKVHRPTGRTSSYSPDYIFTRYSGGFTTRGFTPYWMSRSGNYSNIPFVSAFPYFHTTKKQKVIILKNEEKRLKNTLKAIQKRIQELEREITEKKGGYDNAKR